MFYPDKLRTAAGGEQSARWVAALGTDREEFVELWSRWIMVGRVQRQRASIRRGFELLLPVSVVRNAGLNAREFEAVLCGSSEIDVDDWEQNVVIKGNHPDSAAVVARFWYASFFI